MEGAPAKGLAALPLCPGLIRNQGSLPPRGSSVSTVAVCFGGNTTTGVSSRGGTNEPSLTVFPALQLRPPASPPLFLHRSLQPPRWKNGSLHLAEKCQMPSLSRTDSAENAKLGTK